MGGAEAEITVKERGANVLHRHLRTFQTAALLAAVPLIGAGSPSRAATEPPPPALPAGRQGSDVDLDAQLEAARKRLDEAALEVARLSTQKCGAVSAQVRTAGGSGCGRIVVTAEPAP